MTTQTLEEEERTQSVLRRAFHPRRHELVAGYLGGWHGGGVSKRLIWDHFVDDLTNDPVIEHSRTPVEAATRWRLAKPLTHSTRFHVYAKSMGEMTFVSGEVALTVDNVETFSWETNVGVIRSENIAGKVQEMFDRLVVGASVNG